ncbi:hypothetical protein SAMN05880590_11017 [Rhizobium sp. RU35A]|uniref:hypothetical protein n=1 Tax=Rhizobium sp. RU35A TaxID=1907414 RepID=UPI000954AF0E|nr:hypothetical protein [Rhizobium sp. RU35A]SIQ99045.1 hypothetical protein SAMN05880590_11017 [Rhizobium sp. RU35A]
MKDAAKNLGDLEAIVRDTLEGNRPMDTEKMGEALGAIVLAEALMEAALYIPSDKRAALASVLATKLEAVLSKLETPKAN